METASYTYQINRYLKIISFNSIYFSNRNRPDNDPGVPEKLLQWISDQLEAAYNANQKVLFLYHLPHGTFVSPFGNETFWRPEYEARFLSLFHRYQNLISLTVTGHTHISYHRLSIGLKDTYRVTNANDGTTPEEAVEQESAFDATYHGGSLMVNRALSPLYINNPGFTIYHFDKVYDYPIRFDEYTFLTKRSYNSTNSPANFWVHLYDSYKDLTIPNLSPKGIAEFLQSIQKNPVKLLKYMFYKLGEPLEFSLDNDSCLAKAREMINQVCSQYIEDRLESRECATDLIAKFRYAEHIVDDSFAKYVLA